MAAHALRGQVRVRAYHPPAPSLAAGRVVLLERDGRRQERRVLSAGRHGHGLVLLTIEGVGDRNAAEALIGSIVLVRREDMPPADPDEFYHHEILGFDVVTVEGRALGTVVETMVTGLNDVWIVRDGTHEHLIPVIADVVRSIDHAARRITIDPLPGLLDG